MQKSEAGEGERKMGLFSSKKQSIHGLGGAANSARVMEFSGLTTLAPL